MKLSTQQKVSQNTYEEPVRRYKYKNKYTINKVKKFIDKLTNIDEIRQSQLKSLRKLKDNENIKKGKADQSLMKNVSLKRQKQANLLIKYGIINNQSQCLNCIIKLSQNQQFIFDSYVFGCPILASTQFQFDMDDFYQAIKSKELYFVQQSQKFLPIIQEVFVKGINYRHCYAFLGLKQSEKKETNLQSYHTFRLRINKIIPWFTGVQEPKKQEYTSYVVQGVPLNQEIIQVFNKSCYFVFSNFLYPRQIIDKIEQVWKGISIDYIPVKQAVQKCQRFVIRIKFDFREHIFDQLVYLGFYNPFIKNKIYFRFYQMTDVKGKVIEEVKSKMMNQGQNNEIFNFYEKICDYSYKCLKYKKRKKKYLISQKICGHYPHLICQKVNQIIPSQLNEIFEEEEEQLRKKFGRVPNRKYKRQFILIVTKLNSEFVELLNQRMGKTSIDCKFQQIGEIILSNHYRSIYYLTSKIKFKKIQGYKQIIQKSFSPHPLLLQPKSHVCLQNYYHRKQAMKIISKHLQLIRESIQYGQILNQFDIKDQIQKDYSVFLCPNVKTAIIIVVLLQSGGIKTNFEGDRVIEKIQQFFTIK